MYCIDCRLQHAERSKATLRKHGKLDLPRCDTTDNKECERVTIWQDSNKVKHNEPFKLHKNNFIAYELYERVVSLSDTKEYNWTRNKKSYRGSFPTLSSLEFILSNFLPEETTQDGLDLIIEKISIIHNIRLTNFIG